VSEIRIEGLSKSYRGGIRALHEVSFSIPAGSIFGLLGPNGSGKTTLIKVLVGIIQDFRGIVTIDGVRLPSRRVSPLLGYMPQAFALYTDLTVRENLDFFGATSGLRDPVERRRRITELLALLELGDKRDQVVGALSGGMKQRVSLGCALLHRPRLLLLDEPTIGLDPRLRLQFWEYFRAQAASGSTILITTHVFDEAKYCRHLALLRSGSLITAGGTEELMRAAGVSDFEQVYLHYIGSGDMERA
jgi:ABC-2 type transport system ATP-binding protein